MKMFFISSRERTKNIIDFQKKKNVTANKRRIKVASRWENVIFVEEES